MAIILEGFDNSGKSTLAGSLTWPIYHPGPRPRSEVEESKCLADQLRIASTDVIMDRVTAISQMAYTGDFTDIRRRYADSMSKNPKVMIIYCRPPIHIITDFSKHEVKSYDEEKWIKYIQDNCNVIVERYDDIMKTLPHVIYDWTNPNQSKHLINIFQGIV